MKPTFKQLRDWKRVECPACEFQDICPQDIRGIIDCLEEENYSYGEADWNLLVKQTIRRICAEDRRTRREEQQNRSSFRTNEPKHEYATLYCADYEEFKACGST